MSELCLVLHAFPLDPGLPGLVHATDPGELVTMLGPVLTSGTPGLVLEDGRAEVVRYRPSSCVLRYELAWHLPATRRSLKQVVYGKVTGDDRGRLVGPAVTALRQSGDGGPARLPFLVPRFQAYLPDLALALVDAVPGTPLLPALIRAGGATGADAALARSTPTPESAVQACARIAAVLHRSAIPVGARRTLRDEIEQVRTGIAALAPLAPGLAASLDRHVGALGGIGLDPPGRSWVAHGDFRPSQVLFDGPTTGLVDFDTVCLAEPALDLGEFTAHLAVVAARPGHVVPSPRGPGDDLEGVFLREYLRRAGEAASDVLPARVAAYRTVALTRLALRSWSRFRPERLRAVMGLLDAQQRTYAA
jgi:hypothetical protein